MNQEEKFFITVVSILAGLFTYFLLKLWKKYKKNGSTWRQVFTGLWTGQKCFSKIECASNKCQQNYCMI